MKSASVRELKLELQDRSPKEVMELCLRLSRFKKENKELLTYLLFETSDEQMYIESVKEAHPNVLLWKSDVDPLIFFLHILISGIPVV